ncbi:hypothetical protein [Luteimonas sp. J16]|nr:hypothetical protein [Luteimonas sp. J16]
MPVLQGDADASGSGESAIARRRPSAMPSASVSPTEPSTTTNSSPP